MKKSLAIICVFAFLFALCSCVKNSDSKLNGNKKANNNVSSEILIDNEEINSKGSSTSQTFNTDSYTIVTFEDGSSVVMGNTFNCTVPYDTTDAKSDPYRSNIYARKTSDSELPPPLSEEKGNQVKEIVHKYKMDKPSWDNLFDYYIIIYGTIYDYDSYTGIIQYDDTHADKLSESDRKTLNKIIGASGTIENETEITSGQTVTDTFMVKSVNGTTLTLARYDKKYNVYHEGYTCNYANLDGSADMKFKVGDIVTIVYDPNVAETYPMQLTVYEIIR